nr:hypothetical protein [Planctomycetota bacterium]
MLRSSIGIGGAALVLACLALGLAPQDEARAEKDAKPAPIHVRLDAQGDVKATWKDAAGKAS